MKQSWRPINILFRNDDPCALSNVEHERRYLEIFAKHHIPQVVSVIPFVTEDPHNYRGTQFHELSENKAIVEMLREYADKGLIEIAQHGTTHQTNHLHPNKESVAPGTYYQGLDRRWLPFAPKYPEKGYSEFNGLDKNLVRKELKRGKDYLEDIFHAPVETFTFPWGSLDLNSLIAMKEERFKTALCGGRFIYFVKDLMTIYNAREDVFSFAEELSNGRLKDPVLYHVVLHSWMLKDPDFVKLDKLLSDLASDQRIGFVTARDLHKWPVNFKMIRTINHKVRVWGQVANRHLSAPIQFAQRYDLNSKNYWGMFLKNGLVTLIFEKIGLGRFWMVSGQLFVLCVLLWVIGLGSFSEINRILLICTGGLFGVVSIYRIRNQFPMVNYWIKKPSYQDYKLVSGKAFSDPQNRVAVKAFFYLFEQRSSVYSEDREKYLQLKYYHSKAPWDALNELAADYVHRSLKSLAQMCYAESLRLNPKQEVVYSHIQKLRNSVCLKMPVLHDDRCAISVIVMTNRFPKELKTCIRSILANTFQDFEIVVLNNNGPQEIRQVVGSFLDPRIIYKEIDSEVGIPKGRNLAVQLARGKYVAYLDDDDIFYPDHLETLYSAVQKGKYRFAYVNTQGVLGYLQGDEFYRKKEVFNWNADFDRERFASQVRMGNCAVLHERSLFHDLSLFNEELIVSEEEDFYLRCAAAMELKHINKNTSEYRIKDNNSVVVNAVRNHFQGAIVRQFHAAFKGELALLKYFVKAHDKKSAQETSDKIRAQYSRGYFKSSFVLKELLPLLKFCGDGDFLRIVASDLSRLYLTGDG